MLYTEKLKSRINIHNQKYFDWYVSIVSHAATRPKRKSEIPFYTELHHVLPKSLCLDETEKKDGDNHVLLSLKEHAIVHKLLAKCDPSSKALKRAYLGMFKARNDLQEKPIITSRDYEYFRYHSKDLYGRKGEENGMFGKSHSEHTKKLISEKAKGRKVSDETRVKMRPRQTGKNNHFFGKSHNQETRKTISEKLNGKTTYVKCYILKDPMGNEYKLFTKARLIEFSELRQISYKKIESFLNKGPIPKAKVELLMNEKTKNSVGWSAISKTIPIANLFSVL
jgi:hypothetical protein